MTIRHFLVLAILLVVPAANVLSQRPQIETGTRTGTKGVRLALPEFQSRNADEKTQTLTNLFNEVLWNDLEFSGNVILTSRSFYPSGVFSNPGDIKPEEWVKPGIEAEFIAFGNSAVASGRFIVEARLWDLKLEQNREMIGQRYTGGDDSEESTRMLAHMFADNILERLGFGKGVARTKIAFVADRANGTHKEIYVMDYDGHNATPLTSLKSLALTPSWAPDGEKIAYTSYKRGAPDIEIVSLLDRRIFPFQRIGGSITTTPSWSPDGSRIAFATSVDNHDGTEIYVADWNGRNSRRLTVSKGIDVSPVFNPKTGREVAFVSDRSGTTQIYIMDVDGTNLRRITNEGGSAVNPAWSPDGQFIAFALQKPRTPNFDIHIYSLASDNTTQLTEGAGSNERPSWAPDGLHLAFESTRTGTPQIFSMLADGTKVRQLTRVGRNQGPAWSGYIGQ